MTLTLVKSFELSKASRNQDVRITNRGNHIEVSTTQTSSTPGAIVSSSELEQGIYTFSCNARSNAINRAFLCVWVNGQKVGRSQYFTPESSEQSVEFEILEPSKAKFAILIHSVTSGQEVCVCVYEAKLHIRGADTPESSIEDMSECPSAHEGMQDEVYIYSRGSEYGHGSFIRNLSLHYSVRIVNNSKNVIEHNRDKKHVLFNGFTTEIESLITRLPNKEYVHVIWHSMFRGSALMGEIPRLHNVLRFRNTHPINCYLVSPSETLPNGWKRFPLPLCIDRAAEFNVGHISDIALPLGSPHSNICKNLNDTVIKALAIGCSFSVTKELAQSLDIELLKESFAPKSSESWHIYEGTHQPIGLDYFRSAAIYVLPSISDSMPYTVIESVNSGVPVLISSDVGWASVFAETQRVPRFIFGNVEDLLIQARVLTTNLHARKALWAYQKRALLDTELSRKSLLRATMPYALRLPMQKEKVITLDIANQLEQAWQDIEDNSECIHLIRIVVACDKLNRRLITQVSISNVETKTSVNVQDVLTSQQFKNSVTQKNYWNLLHTLLTPSSCRRVPISIQDDLNSEFDILVIDQFGWAFDNIANEIIKKQHSKNPIYRVTIPEVSVLAQSGLDVFKNVRVAVAFWYFTTKTIKSLCPNAKILTALYDHYSWVVSPDALLEAISYSDALAFGNAPLKNDVLKFCEDNQADVSDKKVYTLKDGVCPRKFYSWIDHRRPKRPFTFGWIGKATQSSDFDPSIKDLKGVSIIKDAFALLKSSLSEDSNSIALRIYDANCEPLIPHDEMRDSFYAHIDCLVCASKSEGTPNTVFEALACGIPVLSTDVGNVSDVMIEGANGYFFNRDAESLAHAMELVRHTAWSTALIEDSVSEFHWDKKAKMWSIALDSLRNNSK